MNSVKTKNDFTYIQKLFAIEPIAWARYDDGRLSFISPTGQKFVYTPEMLEKIASDLDQKVVALKADATAKKPASAIKSAKLASKPASKNAKK